MSLTPLDASTPLRNIKPSTDDVRCWYYLEYDVSLTKGFIRGPFTVEYMRKLIKDGTIDDSTLVSYFYSDWHTLKEVSDLFATPSPKATAKPVRRRTKSQELVMLGVLLIILELVLVYWTGLA